MTATPMQSHTRIDIRVFTVQTDTERGYNVRDTENDLDVVFSNLVQRRAGGLVISAAEQLVRKRRRGRTDRPFSFRQSDTAHRDRTGWLGLRGLELRNVIAKYLFEKSRGFAAIQPIWQAETIRARAAKN